MIRLFRTCGIALSCGAIVAGGCAGSKATRTETGTASSGSAGEGESKTRTIAGTHYSAAEQAVREGDTERALEEFQKAIEVNPELVAAHMGIADIYRMRGDYNRAEQYYGVAAKRQPQNFDAQYYHGLMLHLLDRLTEAIPAYLKALAIRPGDFKTNLNLATAYYQLDENAQALPYAKRSVEINPSDGAARINLGAIYNGLGRYSDAVKEYQQAAELMPLTPQLLVNLADSLGKLERYEEMANALTKCVQMEPSAVACERLGFARFRLAQYDKARQSFEEATRLDANYYPALNGLGVSLLNDWIRGGRKDGALKDRGTAALRRSLQINHEQPQILEILTRYAH